MKNVSITIALGLFLMSCVKSQYANLDSQFARSSSHSISEKYNNKNCIERDQKHAARENQIAVVAE